MDILTESIAARVAQVRLPDVKAPVDLLALIQEYGDAKFKYGAQSVSDRWHQEYADAPDLTAITEEVERLQGAEFELSEILQSIEGGGNVVTFSEADIQRYRALLAEATGEQQ